MMFYNVKCDIKIISEGTKTCYVMGYFGGIYKLGIYYIHRKEIIIIKDNILFKLGISERKAYRNTIYYWVGIYKAVSMKFRQHSKL